MAREICGIIVPRQYDIHQIREFTDSDYLAECILPRHPLSDTHVFMAPDFRYFAWNDDECDCCLTDEPDRCYQFWQIDEAELQKIMRRG